MLLYKRWRWQYVLSFIFLSNLVLDLQESEGWLMLSLYMYSSGTKTLWISPCQQLLFRTGLVLVGARPPTSTTHLTSSFDCSSWFLPEIRQKYSFSSAQKWDFGCLIPKMETTFFHANISPEGKVMHWSVRFHFWMGFNPISFCFVFYIMRQQIQKIIFDIYIWWLRDLPRERLCDSRDAWPKCCIHGGTSGAIRVHCGTWCPQWYMMVHGGTSGTSGGIWVALRTNVFAPGACWLHPLPKSKTTKTSTFFHPK